MQLNLRLRSLYVLLLCLYIPYMCCYYSCNETLPAPGAPRGASTCSRWHPDELHGCRLCTSDARRIRDLDKSITSFYPGRLTTNAIRVAFLAIAWAMQLLVGVVLCLLTYVIPLREAICAMRMPRYKRNMIRNACF